MIPQVTRRGGPPDGLPGPAMPTGQRASDGDGMTAETLRDEINDLRKQISDLALERDVLMRSLALWARGSAE